MRPIGMISSGRFELVSTARNQVCLMQFAIHEQLNNKEYQRIKCPSKEGLLRELLQHI